MKRNQELLILELFKRCVIMRYVTGVMPTWQPHGRYYISADIL